MRRGERAHAAWKISSFLFPEPWARAGFAASPILFFSGRAFTGGSLPVNATVAAPVDDGARTRPFGSGLLWGGGVDNRSDKITVAVRLIFFGYLGGSSSA